MANVSAFASALQKGLGRAMVLLRQDPLNLEYREALLHACKTNQIYDVQCEEPRAPYLCRLIREIGAHQVVWDELHREVAGARDDDRGRNRVQMFAVLCVIAGEHQYLDRSKLRALLSLADYDLVFRDCMDDLVRLEGVAGLEFCFMNFERQLVEDEWPLGFLLSVLFESMGKDAAEFQIQQVRERNPVFDGLMRVADANALPEPPKQLPLDREAINTMLKAGSVIPYYWISSASKDDVDWAAGGLKCATTDHERQQLLRFFRKHDFPGHAAHLTAIARDSNLRGAQSAAVDALARISHPDVRSLAVQLLSDKQRVSDGIRLLARNWNDGDLTILEGKLALAGDDDDAIHDVAFCIPEVLVDLPPGRCDPGQLLSEIYEKNPCSNCRHGAVRAMVGLRCMPARLAEECQYDANADIVALVRNP